MKNLRQINYFVLIFLLLFLNNCKNSTGQVESDRSKTLESLRKVDDFPLYVLHYYGDYKFQEFLENGIEALGRSETEKNLEKWACTCSPGSFTLYKSFGWLCLCFNG